ncbi:hypothetical protein K440DRAFT_537169, partial [Wilcoxina mikolae CBS 423.85]
RLLASKFTSQIDCQMAYISNSCTIADHIRKLSNLIWKYNIQTKAITNVNEKSLIIGYSKCTKMFMRRE